MELYVSYAHQNGFGWMTLIGREPPRNTEEIKLLHNFINEANADERPYIGKCAIISWKELK